MFAYFVGGHVMLNDDDDVTRNGMRSSTRDTSTKDRTRRKDVGTIQMIWDQPMRGSYLSKQNLSHSSLDLSMNAFLPLGAVKPCIHSCGFADKYGGWRI